MKHQKKLAYLLVSCQLLMALTSCTSTTPTESTGGTSTNTSTGTETGTTGVTGTGTEVVNTYDLDSITDAVLEIAGVGGHEVVATAGGKEITAQEMLYFATSEVDYSEYMAMYGMGYTPWGEDIDGELYEVYAKKNAVELALIYQTIIDVAEEEGLEYTEASLAETTDYLAGTRSDLNNDERLFEYVLWTSVMTEDLFMHTNKVNALYQAIHDVKFGENGTDLPSEEDTMAYLEEQGYYHVKHILLTNTDDMNAALSDAEIAEKKAFADELIETLNASSNLEEDFHELMLEHSEDPGSISQPDGYMALPGQMVTEFEEGSLALAEGEMSGIVESNFGFHIILRLPLTVDTSYMEEMIGDLAMELQDSWVSQYTIEYTEVFDKIDLELFYTNLTLLREQVNPFVTVGSSDPAVLEAAMEEAAASSDASADSGMVYDPDAVAVEPGTGETTEATTEETTEEETTEEETTEEETTEEATTEETTEEETTTEEAGE